MKKLYLRFIPLVFISLLFVLSVSRSEAAEPTPTPAPTSSPQAGASATPLASPKATPTASSSSAAVAATPAATSQPAASSTGGDDKKSEVLGSTDVLGATGTEREIAKWIFVLGTGFTLFLIGLKVARTVKRADEE